MGSRGARRRRGGVSALRRAPAGDALPAGVGIGPSGAHRAGPAAERLSGASAGHSSADHPSGRGRHDRAWPAVLTRDRNTTGETPGRRVHARRPRTADAARLALHVLLPQLLRDESVPGEPGLRGLSASTTAAASATASSSAKPPDCGAAAARPNTRTSSAAGALSARPRRRGPGQHRARGAGPTAAISPRSGSRATPTCSPPEWTCTASTTGPCAPLPGGDGIARGRQESARRVPGRLPGHLDVAGPADPRRRRPQRRFQPDRRPGAEAAGAQRSISSRSCSPTRCTTSCSTGTGCRPTPRPRSFSIAASKDERGARPRPNDDLQPGVVGRTTG